MQNICCLPYIVRAHMHEHVHIIYLYMCVGLRDSYIYIYMSMYMYRCYVYMHIRICVYILCIVSMYLCMYVCIVKYTVYMHEGFRPPSSLHLPGPDICIHAIQTEG